MTPAILPSKGEGPTVVRVKPQTDAWHMWRLSGYGGSDAVNLWTAHFQTPQDVHKSKLGLVPPKHAPSEAMLRGIALEPLARSIMESTLGQVYRPACVSHPTYPWCIASLDGLRRRGRHRRIIELKAPGKSVHDEVKAGHVPDFYRYQVRNNLIAAQADVCAFGSLWFNPEADEYDFQYVEVAYSDIQDEVDEHLDSYAEWWSFIRRHELPPITDLDVLERTAADETYAAAAGLFVEADRAYKKADAARKAARLELLELCDHPRVRGCGVSVVTFPKAGAINYNHPLIQRRLESLDLNQFRFESTDESRVTVLKDAAQEAAHALAS